ncbi:MAG: HD domain-containing protein [Proteobacteria bacterium]|nr:HD domain-containing protein [Pseudomonadota bacterium]
MSRDLVESVAQRFQTFAAPYLDEPGDDFAYRLKIEHTDRVRAIATDIADASGVSDRVNVAARLAALLHDVGRFPQYKQYRTFRDAESANHALLSVRHALREGMLAEVPTDLRRVVLGAVFLHNVRTLPTNLPPETLAVSRIVRDSDKLDIFRVMIAHFSQTEPAHPEVALHVKLHPTAYSQEIITALLKGDTGDYRNIVWVNDFKLMVAGWMYDLNYRHSCQLLHDHGYLDTIFDTLLPQDPQILEMRRRIMEHLAHRLADA